MNAERLIHYYQQIADAPDAVAQLRRFILDLAVRGKLVPQDPNDEPASVLLERIEEEKSQFIQISGMRKDKPLPELKEDEIPYPIAQNWAWTRIRTITSDRGQRIPNSTFSYIDVSAIDKENGCIGQVTILEAEDAPSRARKVVQKGDLIYSCVRPYLLNVAIIHNDINPPPIASTAFAVLNGFGLTLAKYQWIVLRSPFMVAEVESKMRGQAYPAINDSDFALLPFPLPPLAEQKRIVERVDQLMALCDQLEAARANREQLRSQFSAATLARLNQPAEDQAVFRTDAGFALQHFATLSATPTQIKALRQTILNLAVRGKLVPQDPNDEPASVLLERIAEEKSAKGLKSKKTQQDIFQQENYPFDVPNGWCWSKIEDVILYTEYGTSQKTQPLEIGIPVLTMGNIQDGYVIGKNDKKIPITSEELPRLYLKKFDILYNRTNSAELVGKTGIYLGEDDVMTFASYLIRMRCSAISSDARYINLVMNTSVFRETQIIPHIKQQTGQANVNGTILKNMRVPIPPLAEQKRIVERVDLLMALCDQLEASLQQAENVQHQLLKAVLHSALEPVEQLEAA